MAPKGDEDRIFALAELSFLHAQNSGDRSYYLAAAVYAYAFVLPGQRGTPPRGIDPRLRWAVDFYNQALTQAAKSDEGAYAIPMGGKFKLPFGELTVTFNERDLLWSGFRMKDFIPAADIEVRGLRNRYRTPGIGAALAASIEPLEGEAGKQSMRIPPRLKIPVTVFLRLEDPRAALASGKLTGNLEFYTPDSARSLKIEGVDVADRIRNDFGPRPDSGRGAGLGLRDRWVSLRRLRIGGANLREGLFMLHPHKPGRMPVVLVHGTASSPARWAELINELENDPRFWEHYEIWLFMYNTGNPDRLFGDAPARCLVKVVKELDPDDKDAGLKRMVVMGHSQGGLLTKMTVIDSGMQLWPFSVPPEELDMDVETLELAYQCAHDQASAVRAPGGIYRNAASRQLPGSRYSGKLSPLGW